MPRVKAAPSRRPVRRRVRIGFITWPPTRHTLRVAGTALAVTVALGGSLYLWRAGLPDSVARAVTELRAMTLRTTAAAGLSVQEIFVEGRDETSGADILAALGLERGTPILAFDPAEAKRELERLPWVREASVERRLPDTVHVRIVERKPLALWQRHGQLTLIDHDGVEIRTADPARFSHLPVVVGDDAPKHAAQLLALLATEPELERRVTAAIRVGGRRWNLRLDADNGAVVDVQLPEVNPGAAWMRLAELERTSKLLDRNITTIDLRIPDRLILRVVRETQPSVPSRSGRGNGRTT